MTHHQDSMINIPLSIVLVTLPWWIPAIEEFSWIAGKLILPGLGIALAVLQIWYMVRKHKILGGNKPD